MKIAIDGPAGAGKSTVAKLLAGRLGAHYLDTGAMYRAMAYALMEREIDVKDVPAVLAALEGIDISIRYDDQGQRVLAGGRDVTDYIRTPAVSRGASDVAVIPEVRLKLVKTQRETAEVYDIVMDGRDIGTYVLPDADAKFFVTASSRERAIRRQKDLAAAGIDTPLDALEAEIIARDETDSNREFAPLRAAEDALVIDTTQMSVEQVLEAMLRRIQEG